MPEQHVNVLAFGKGMRIDISFQFDVEASWGDALSARKAGRWRKALPLTPRWKAAKPVGKPHWTPRNR